MPQALNLTDAEIESLWDAGNNAGRGFAIGLDHMTPREAAEMEGLTEVRTFDTANSTAHCVVGRIGSMWVAVCDSNGPWAVTLVVDNVLKSGRRYDVNMLEFTGWSAGDGTSTEGYNVADFFAADGSYLGPDEHGIEPEFKGEVR